MNRREFVVAAAALPFVLRSGRALAADPPRALVTADTEAQVLAVALGTGRVLRRIPTLGGPRSIEAVGRTAVVAHTALGAVSLIDGATLSVRHVLRSFVEPRYAAAAQDGRHAFVTDSGSAELVSVDVVRGRVVGRLHLGAWPRHLSLDAHRLLAWVALGNEAEQLALVDISRPERLRLVARIQPPFLAHDVGVAPGSRHVWVTSGDRGSLAVYDAAERSVVRRVDADAPPQHVTFLGGVAYVSSGAGGSLRLHRLSDGRALRTVPLPIGSYNVQQAHGLILTPSLDRGTLCVLDRHGRLLERTTVAPSSHDACVV